MSSRTASALGFIRSAAVIGLIAISLFPVPRHAVAGRGGVAPGLPDGTPRAILVPRRRPGGSSTASYENPEAPCCRCRGSPRRAPRPPRPRASRHRRPAPGGGPMAAGGRRGWRPRGEPVRKCGLEWRAGFMFTGGRADMTRLRPAILARISPALLAAAALAAFAGRPAAPSTSSSTAGAPRAAARPDGSGGGEAVDLEVVTRIRDEGFHRSQALATAAYLSDRIGSRLTGTPELKEANEWTRRQLAGWGLANAHLEGWRFGRGWSFSRAVVAMSLTAAARAGPAGAPPGAPAPWRPRVGRNAAAPAPAVARATPE